MSLTSAEDPRASSIGDGVKFYDIEASVKLRVAQWPRATDAADRGVLVLFHGLAEHLGRWASVAAHFAALGYDVTAFDHRGHGESGGERVDTDGPFTIVNDAAVVVAAVTDAARPFTLLGHSMGGLLAVVYVEKASDADCEWRVPDKLVLSAPAVETDQAWILQKLVPVLSWVAPSGRASAGVTGEQLSDDPAVGEAYFADPYVKACERMTFRFGKCFLETAAFSRAHLAKITCPTLVYHGQEDTLVPPRASETVHAGVASSELTMLEGVRHEAHNTSKRDQVLEMVDAFLKK